VKGFGGNAGQGFRVEDVLHASDVPVRPIAPGTVVFVFQKGSQRGPVPSPLGDFVVVQHDRGFRSIYGHLDPASIRSNLKVVTQHTVVGRSGESGYSEQSGLSLRVIDSKRHRLVNPLVVLPSLRDRLDPEVHAVYLKSTGLAPLTEGLVIRPGRWSVLADISDQGQGTGAPAPVAPYSLDLSLDGTQISHVEFQDLRFRKGELFLDSSYRWNFDALYLGRSLYNLGEPDLQAGTHSLRLRTTDFAGHETIVNRTIIAEIPSPLPAAPAGAKP
jgi:hypothetical protein